jgi:predicted N-acetyltransferase YhbS
VAEPSGTILVRRATADDAADIAALINAAFAQYRGRLDPQPSALSETAETLAPQIAAPAGAAVALRLERSGSTGPAMGAVLYRPEEQDLYLGRLAVAPGARRSGIAGALIRFVEDEARRRDCPGIVLGVRLAVPDNQRLFARHGFVEVSRHAHDGYAHPTWMRMRKDLLASCLLGRG